MMWRFGAMPSQQCHLQLQFFKRPLLNSQPPSYIKHPSSLLSPSQSIWVRQKCPKSIFEGSPSFRSIPSWEVERKPNQFTTSKRLRIPGNNWIGWLSPPPRNNPWINKKKDFWKTDLKQQCGDHLKCCVVSQLLLTPQGETQRKTLVRKVE